TGSAAAGAGCGWASNDCEGTAAPSTVATIVLIQNMPRNVTPRTVRESGFRHPRTRGLAGGSPRGASARPCETEPKLPYSISPATIGGFDPLELQNKFLSSSSFSASYLLGACLCPVEVIRLRRGRRCKLQLPTNS